MVILIPAQTRRPTCARGVLPCFGVLALGVVFSGCIFLLFVSKASGSFFG